MNHFLFVGRTILVATLAGAWVVSATLFAQSVLPNGSFENLQDPARGWHSSTGGTVRTNHAHRGERFLHGESRSGAVVWAGDQIVLRPRRDYRLDGWIRCSKGEAWLAINLVDEAGRTIPPVETPSVKGSGWRYVAVEWNAGHATAGHVSFRVKGEADLDDVSLALVETSYMGNKGVEADERGRIPFWGEERSDALLPGRRGGSLKPDASVKRDGKASAQLTPTNDWFALASVNYPAAAWTDRLELSGWARCGASATAQILACWTDDSQNVLRVDASPPVQGSDWQHIVLLPENAPAQAASVRVIAVARGGPVWFDEFELLRLRPRQPRIQVFVNQIGYEREGPKSVVIASNFFPHDADTINFQLVSTNRSGAPPRFGTAGRVVWKQAVTCGGRINGGQTDDWGWYFWRGDFSQFDKPGAYRVVAKAGSVTVESAPFSIGHNLLATETAQSAVDFFYIQRCGIEVPGWHKACHLDDAKLPDGTYLDAIGGWHSAGDYNKLMYEHGDGGVVYALLTAYGSNPTAFGRFDRDHDGLADALDEANWGARFVAKMQIPESGGLRNHVSQGPGRNWTKWSAPEVHTDNKPGTEDDPVIQAGEGNSPLVIAAWARLSALFQERGLQVASTPMARPSKKIPPASENSRRSGVNAALPPDKSSLPATTSSVTNDYLPRAIRLWTHATKGGTEVGSPYLLISGIELHNVTKEPAYLDYTRRSVDRLLSQQTTNGPQRGAFGGFGDASAAALAQFALAYPKDERNSKIKRALNQYVTFCVGASDNPFGLSPQTVSGTNTFFSADLGNSFQILSRAWAAALVYRVTHDPRALGYAQDHLDWMLGKNPLNLCLFEGKGALNPPRYHHRYNSIPGHERGAVPGTIPNGFVRDMGLADRPGFDLSRAGGRAPSFRTSEPWLVHNLFFLLAASALDQAVGH